MAYIGHGIEGDLQYGKGKNLVYQEGQLLHAYRLTLVHPRTQKEMTFEAPYRSTSKRCWRRLENRQEPRDGAFFWVNLLIRKKMGQTVKKSHTLTCFNDQ